VQIVRQRVACDAGAAATALAHEGPSVRHLPIDHRARQDIHAPQQVPGCVDRRVRVRTVHVVDQSHQWSGKCDRIYRDCRFMFVQMRAMSAYQGAFSSNPALAPAVKRPAPIFSS
jgi:hypothetical protein